MSQINGRGVGQVEDEMQIRLWRDVTGKPLEDDDTLEALTNRLLNTLTPREEKVLRARYGLFDGRVKLREQCHRPNLDNPRQEHGRK